MPAIVIDAKSRDVIALPSFSAALVSTFSGLSKQRKEEQQHILVPLSFFVCHLKKKGKEKERKKKKKNAAL